MTDGDGEVGRGRELALDPPPTLRVSTLRVLPGDPLLRGQGRGAGCGAERGCEDVGRRQEEQ